MYIVGGGLRQAWDLVNKWMYLQNVLWLSLLSNWVTKFGTDAVAHIY